MPLARRQDNSSSCGQHASLPAGAAHQHFLYWKIERCQATGGRRFGRNAYQFPLLCSHTRFEWLSRNLCKLELWCEKVRGLRSSAKSKQGHYHARNDSDRRDLSGIGRNSNCTELGSLGLLDCLPLLLRPYSRDLGSVDVRCKQEVFVSSIRNLYPRIHSAFHAHSPRITLLSFHRCA